MSGKEVTYDRMPSHRFDASLKIAILNDDNHVAGRYLKCSTLKLALCAASLWDACVVESPMKADVPLCELEIRDLVTISMKFDINMNKFYYFILSSCLVMDAVAATRDMRDDISRQTTTYKNQHPAETLRIPQREHSVAQFSVSSRSSAELVPGGVGYGYDFEDNSLLWENSVVLDYFIITPDRAGGNMDYWLYLTSTNRSNLGTEAYIAYYGRGQATFKVFDWARDNQGLDPRPVSINLPGLNPQYLAMRRSERGQMQQMCRVSNGTHYLGRTGNQHNWRNEVHLFNFPLDAWDLIYQYDYTTSTKAENTFQSGEHYGSWGPIVEVWEDDHSYDDLNVLGFDLCRLYLDSEASPVWLGASNTSKRQMAFFNSIDPFPSSRSFTVYTGDSDRDGDGHSFEDEAIANTDPTDPSDFLQTFIELKPNGTVELAVTPPASGRVYSLEHNGGLSMSWDPLASATCYSDNDLSFLIDRDTGCEFFKTKAIASMGSLSITCNIQEASFTFSPEAGYLSTAKVPGATSALYTSTYVCLPAGQYLLEFDSVPGFVAPDSIYVEITEGGIVEINAVYGE